MNRFHTKKRRENPIQRAKGVFKIKKAKDSQMVHLIKQAGGGELRGRGEQKVCVLRDWGKGCVCGGREVGGRWEGEGGGREVGGWGWG